MDEHVLGRHRLKSTAPHAHLDDIQVLLKDIGKDKVSVCKGLLDPFLSPEQGMRSLQPA